MVEYKKNISIAFLNAHDLEKNWSWYETFSHMAQAIQTHCGDVFHLGPIRHEEEHRAKNKHDIIRKSGNKNFVYYFCVSVSRAYANIITDKLKDQHYDIIIAISGETEIAFLDTDIPIILVNDATYGQLMEYHEGFLNLTKESVHELHLLESRALQKAQAAVFSSDWASQSAIEMYQTDPDKIYVVPFGANLEYIPPKELVIRHRKADTCKLLFVGRDWDVKGGEIAYETLISLEALGQPAELTICGCTPPSNTFQHERLHIIPFLDKEDPQQRKKFETLYEEAHFFILPTRTDCTPIVFCEANAFALPVISTNTGGISGVIKENINGFLLPFEAQGRDYAKIIYDIYKDDCFYANLRISSRKSFDNTLNWDAWGRALNEIIEKILFKMT